MSTNGRTYTYSDRERKLLKMVSSSKKIKSSAITSRIYNDKVPINGRIVVSTAMRQLINKVEANGETFKIRSEAKPGSRELSYWRE